ncbi:MAG: TlpA disulfide reductase family protein [Bacteroidota bacterium]
MKSLLLMFALLIASIQIVSNNTITEPETAPDFVVKTLEGEELALSDLRGKVVYISFWASWCAPCIAGFRKYEKLRRQLAEVGVVLLNVSIDKTEEAWLNGLVSIPPVGIQAFAKQDKTQLMQHYELGSIPAYYIVNKKGSLVYLSSRPDRNIVEEFKNWVEE